jgi:hypothetical protein
MKKPLFSLFFIPLFLAFYSASYAADIYKWVDKDGQIHYSEIPPQDVDAQRIKGANNQPGGTDNIMQQEKAFEQRREERLNKAAEQEKAQAEQLQHKQECEKIRQTYDMQNTSRRVAKEVDGQMVIMSEEDRSKRREELRQMLEKDCKGF